MFVVARVLYLHLGFPVINLFMDLTEIEAREACDWLRAAGFPQYVQLYRDGKFPIDVEWAKQDHAFLDKDAVDSFCRRLKTLNKSAELRLELRRAKRREVESEEEDFCALSPNWTYDRSAKKWHRVESRQNPSPNEDLALANGDRRNANNSSCSSDSEGLDHVSAQARGSPRFHPRNKSRSLDSPIGGCPSTGSSGVSLEDGGLERSSRKRGSSLLRKIDKLKLRRINLGLSAEKRLWSLGSSVEEDDSPQSPANSPASSCPSSPQSTSQSETSGRSLSQSESSSLVSTPSPVTRVRSNSKRGFSSETESNPKEQATEGHLNQMNLSLCGLTAGIPLGPKKPRTFPSLSPSLRDWADVLDHRTGSYHGHQRRRPGAASLSADDQGAPSCGGGVIAPEPRLSVYDNVQGVSGDGSFTGTDHSEGLGLQGSDEVFSALDRVLERITDLQEQVSSWTLDLTEDQDLTQDLTQDSPQDLTQDLSQDSTQDLTQDSPQDLTQDLTQDSTQDLTQDLTQDSKPDSPNPHHPHSSDLNYTGTDQDPTEEQQSSESTEAKSGVQCPPFRSARPGSDPGCGPGGGRHGNRRSPKCGSGPRGLEALSCSELALLQKLSLLRLTALMDKFSPGNGRQGWSWTVPKPQRKPKASENKGRRLFGVPLLVNMQQTGEPLPPSVLRAMVYLRSECVDQMGVFRKSGLKSRIQALREQLESGPERVSFSGLSAFDVADLIKQYLRDLPEPLLSAKLNHTVLNIYQYFPQEVQLGAVQAAILLLPDERREALRTLLYFLHDVVSSSEENHMTHTNMAVCLAPSLFHLSAGRDNHRRRPGRRKSSLGPDQRDLRENLAATQALGHMISEAHALFQLPVFWPSPSSTLPGTGEMAGSQSPGHHGDSAEEVESLLRLQRNTESLLTLSQEQDWSGFTTPDGLRLDYSKCSDLSPLPVWRASLELDAPPPAVLRRVLSERAQFDPRLQMESRPRPLGPDSDLIQYQIWSQGHELRSIPPTVYSLHRWWQSDPCSGPLFISAVSVPQQDVPETAHVHCCLYLLEPTGDKKTRLTHLCSTEYRGRSLEWHVKVSGHLLANELLSIRDSFEQENEKLWIC